MEGMGVKFTPGIGGRLLRHSGVFGPMAGTVLKKVAEKPAVLASWQK